MRECKGKDQRDEQRLTAKQRETIAKLARTHGMDAVLERFGGEPWNLTEEGAGAIISAQRRMAPVKTDWSARYAEFARS